ncbi:MAG: type II secretion system F family protein [Betaproteobacteria bacterium]|nr:type II secretion system F family protein [Betaproteobacteria bacterium]
MARFGSRWPAWRAALDRFALHIPLLGRLLSKAALARWAGTFAALFAAGIPLRQTLEAAGGAAGHTVYAEAVVSLQADVTAGQTVSVALARARVFPPMLVQMAAVGEESGSLDGMMAKVADYYEQELAETVARLSNLIEPVLMVVLGLLIGGVVIAMYLPVFRMGSVL